MGTIAIRRHDTPAARRYARDALGDATATSRPVATDCRCQACADLLAECGDALFPIYSKKLLIVGWSGVKSPVERAYVRAHRSEAQQARAALLSARAKAGGFASRITVVDGETAKAASSATRGALRLSGAAARGAV